MGLQAHHFVDQLAGHVRSQESWELAVIATGRIQNEVQNREGVVHMVMQLFLGFPLLGSGCREELMVSSETRG